MRRLITLGLVASVVLFSRPGQAQANVYALQATGVGVLSNGTAFILLGSGVSAGCLGTAQVRFSTTTVGGSDMYKTALAAFVAGRPLKAHLSGCLDNFPVATYIFVE